MAKTEDLKVTDEQLKKLQEVVKEKNLLTNVQEKNQILHLQLKEKIKKQEKKLQ